MGNQPTGKEVVKPPSQFPSDVSQFSPQQIAGLRQLQKIVEIDDPAQRKQTLAAYLGRSEIVAAVETQ
jgi:hypothetical protein